MSTPLTDEIDRLRAELAELRTALEKAKDDIERYAVWNRDCKNRAEAAEARVRELEGK